MESKIDLQKLKEQKNAINILNFTPNDTSEPANEKKYTVATINAMYLPTNSHWLLSQYHGHWLTFKPRYYTRGRSTKFKGSPVSFHIFLFTKMKDMQGTCQMQCFFTQSWRGVADISHNWVGTESNH